MEIVTQFLETAHQQASCFIQAKERLYVDTDLETGKVRSMIRLRGLLPSLQRHFYPHYTHKKRKRCSSNTNIGTIIDEQMQAFVAAGRRLAYGYHPFSLKLVRCFQQHRLQLLATQVPLFDVRQRILTYIDAVGLDYNTNPPTPFLADFKTGYDAGYHAKCGSLLEPFEGIANNLKNHHHLQLAWEIAVAAQPPYSTVFPHAYILRVNHTDKDVKKISLPAWCTKKRRKAMMDKLCIKK